MTVRVKVVNRPGNTLVENSFNRTVIVAVPLVGTEI